MSGEWLRIEDYVLSNDSNDSDVAVYVREERKIVEGSALIFNATGPHNLRMEIHYIQLENGSKWVVGGRAFNGPMWVFGQLNKRLKISITQKEQGYSIDLTNPTPSKKNPEKYTTKKQAEYKLQKTSNQSLYSVAMLPLRKENIDTIFSDEIGKLRNVKESRLSKFSEVYFW